MAQAAPPQKLVLKPGVIHGFLENFSVTQNRECMQFLDIVCSGQELEQLGKAIDEVKDAQNVDFSTNGLSDCAAIKDLNMLVTLNLSNNRIKNVAVFAMDDCFASLKWLDISNNKFTEFPAIKCPKLEYLNINGNKLEKVNEAWTGHENLRTISAVDNKFKNLAPFKAMPKLEELYMGSNQITSLSGWEALPVLKKLHLRRNKIAKIDEEGLPELPELRYINLRHNAFEAMDQVYRLFQFPNLKDINLINNPVELGYSSFRLLMSEILVKNPKVERFCKREVTESNKLEAVHLSNHKWIVSEEKRRKDEAEAAAKEGEDDK